MLSKQKKKGSFKLDSASCGCTKPPTQLMTDAPTPPSGWTQKPKRRPFQPPGSCTPAHIFINSYISISISLSIYAARFVHTASPRAMAPPHSTSMGTDMRAPRLQASLVCFKLLRAATSASPSFAVDDSREPRRVVVVCSSTCAGSGSVGASQTSNCDIQRSVRLDHARAEGAVRSVHRLQCHHAASSAVPSAGRRNMHGNGEAARKFRLSRMPNHCQGAPWRGTWFCECSHTTCGRTEWNGDARNSLRSRAG